MYGTSRLLCSEQEEGNKTNPKPFSGRYLIKVWKTKAKQKQNKTKKTQPNKNIVCSSWIGTFLSKRFQGWELIHLPHYGNHKEKPCLFQHYCLESANTPTSDSFNHIFPPLRLKPNFSYPTSDPSFSVGQTTTPCFWYETSSYSEMCLSQ